jgi:hypothetical protein
MIPVTFSIPNSADRLQHKTRLFFNTKECVQNEAETGDCRNRVTHFYFCAFSSVFFWGRSSMGDQISVETQFFS